MGCSRFWLARQNAVWITRVAIRREYDKNMRTSHQGGVNSFSFELVQIETTRCRTFSECAMRHFAAPHRSRRDRRHEKNCTVI